MTQLQYTVAAHTTKLRLPESVETLDEFDVAHYDKDNYIEYSDIIDNMNNTVGDSEYEL